jgi:hypothetical protein
MTKGDAIRQLAKEPGVQVIDLKVFKRKIGDYLGLPTVIEPQPVVQPFDPFEL